MHKPLSVLLPLFGLLVPVAASLAAAPVSQETTQLRLEQRKESEGDPRINTLGAFGTGNGKMARLDLTYMDAGKVLDEPGRKGGGNIWGMEVSAGYLIPTQITLYVGAGMMLGLQRGDFLYTYYPEAGIVLKVSDGISLTASKKRYMKIYNSTEDAVMIGLALSYH